VGKTAVLVTLQRVVDKYVVTTGLEMTDIKDGTLHALEDFSYRYGWLYYLERSVMSRPPRLVPTQPPERLPYQLPTPTVRGTDKAG